MFPNSLLPALPSPSVINNEIVLRQLKPMSRNGNLRIDENKEFLYRWRGAASHLEEDILRLPGRLKDKIMVIKYSISIMY